MLDIVLDYPKYIYGNYRLELNIKYPKMKIIIIPFLLFSIPMLGVSQNKDSTDYKKHSIMITPLGDLLNNSKSSIYYRYTFVDDSKNYGSFRIGSELFNSISIGPPAGVEDRTSLWNLKAGLEFGKRFGKMILYYGPEISYSRIRISRADLIPSENIIFSTQAILADTHHSIDGTRMNITSIIGFIGFKYKLTNSINIGIESGVAIGWYNSTLIYRSSTQRVVREGFIKDFAVNRFILLEYCF